MQSSIVRYSVEIAFPRGGLNPADVDERVLEEFDVVDHHNQLDKSLYRVGSLGSNFVFSNSSEDEIQIQPTEVHVDSIQIDRLRLIVKAMQSVYEKLIPKTMKLRFDAHLLDESYPESIFKNYNSGTDYKLDVVRFKKDLTEITMYNCGPNTIHIAISRSLELKGAFGTIDLSKTFDVTSMKADYQEFVRANVSRTVTTEIDSL